MGSESSSSTSGVSPSSSSSGTSSSSSSSSSAYVPPVPDEEKRCTDCCCPEYSAGPVRYSSGALRYAETDIEVPGFGEPFRITRTYANKFSRDEQAGGFGYNWYAAEFPYLAVTSGGFGMIQGANDAIWFRDSSQSYRAKFGDSARLGYDSSANRYIATMENGKRFTFAPSSFGPNSWQLEKIRDPGDNSTNFIYLAGLLLGVVRQTSSSGSYFLTAEYDSTLSRVQILTLQYLDPAHPSDPVDLRKVEYEYYTTQESDTSSSGIGNAGDLKKVSRYEYVDSDWQLVSESHYRYYIPSESNGFTHALKYVLGPGAARRAQNEGYDPESNTTTNANLARFADHYFEYDSQHRVTKEVLHGFACGAGSGTYTFAFTNNSHNPTAINEWRTKTVETRPDGSTATVYSNKDGQILLRDLYDGTQHWIEYNKYWDSGDRRDSLLKEHSSPANISTSSPYDDSYDDLHVSRLTSAGLVTYYDYETTISSVNVQGYLKKVEISEGTSGTKIKQKEIAYSASSAGSGPDNQVFYVSSDKVFRDTSGSVEIETTYSNTYHSGTRQVSERVTTLPNVPTSQNGDDSATYYVRERFDTYGYPTWRQDERGVITKFTFNVVTGAMTERIDDSSTAPSGWSLPTNTELAGPFQKNLVTSYESDLLGRITQELGPTHYVVDGTSTAQVQSGSWFVYKPGDWMSDIGPQLWSCRGYKNGSNYKMFDPIQVQIFDFDGKVTDEILSERDSGASSTSKLSGDESYTDSTLWKRWTKNEYGVTTSGGDYLFGCRLSKRKVYYDIDGPSSNDTSFAYDVLGRQNRERSPGGTISRTVYDARGLVLSEWIGTNDDGATDADPTGGGSDPDNNMKKVRSFEYDRNSNRTAITVHVSSSSSDDRVTEFTFDFRNRMTDIDGEESFHEQNTFDNLGQATEVKQYDGSTSGNLLARTETFFDNRGRVYREKRYSVSAGSSGNWLETNRWYDGAANVLKDHPGGSDSYRRIRQDGLGNVSIEYLCYGSSGLGSPSSDTVVEQTDSAYDEAGQLKSTILRRRVWDANTNLGSLDPAVNSSAAASRPVNGTVWRDGIGRVVATGDYGTNTPTTNWWQSAPPASGSSVLVESTAYDSAGTVKEQFDANGKKTSLTYDDAGRRTKVVRNVQGSTSTSDQNNTVETAYNADDKVETIKAVNPTSLGGTGDQTTHFYYGTGSSSELYTSDRLNAIAYPESTGSSDRIHFAYNYAGEVTTRTDELGIIHSLSYDKLGRLTADATSSVPSSVDNTVQQLAWTYEKRGLVETVTSLGASSTVINQVKMTYNGFGLLTKEQQEHSGAVGSGSYDIDYTYGSGLASGSGQNTTRRLTVEYPSGKTFTYGYNSSGSMDDKLSRLKSISESGTGTLIDYAYNGAAFVVASERYQLSLRYELRGGTGYFGLDAFDRIVNLRWYNTVNFPTIVEVDYISYGYDYSSNRTWRENVLDTTNNYDWFYTNDGINRLDEAQRGQLNSGHTGLSTKTFAQDWALDAVGNWHGFKQDFTGSGYTFDQTRDSNLDNEIDTISGSGGADWIDPVYSAVGNMTKIPKPAAPTTSFDAKYDAWNRLVQLKDTSSGQTAAEYVYDGLFRRVVKKTDTSGSLSETRHFYYSDAWQVLEERVEASGSQRLDRQFLWGIQYIDDLILRDRDTNADGTLDERLYAMQDANWNVTALWGLNSGATAWEVKQRFEYSPYGDANVLTAAFAVTSDNYQWERRYAAYCRDTESDLDSVRFRYFHRFLGVWISSDPFIIDENRYVYVDSSPINLFDPSGLGSCCSPGEKCECHHWFPATKKALDFYRKCQNSNPLLMRFFNRDLFATCIRQPSHSILDRLPNEPLKYYRVVDSQIDFAEVFPFTQLQCCEFFLRMVGDVIPKSFHLACPDAGEPEIRRFPRCCKGSDLTKVGLFLLPWMACRPNIRQGPRQNQVEEDIREMIDLWESNPIFSGKRKPPPMPAPRQQPMQDDTVWWVIGILIFIFTRGKSRYVPRPQTPPTFTPRVPLKPAA